MYKFNLKKALQNTKIEDVQKLKLEINNFMILSSKNEKKIGDERLPIHVNIPTGNKATFAEKTSVQEVGSLQKTREISPMIPG